MINIHYFLLQMVKAKMHSHHRRDEGEAFKPTINLSENCETILMSGFVIFVDLWSKEICVPSCS